MVAELVNHARADGALALVGHCVEMGDAELPYAPIVGALRAMADEVDPAELVRDAVSTVAPAAHKREIELLIEARDLPLVRWDQEKVRQAVVMLRAATRGAEPPPGESVLAQVHEVLRAAETSDPGDGPVQTLIERCEGFLASPPEMPFDGIAKLEK